MKALLPMMAVVVLSACASTAEADADKLVLYQAHAGPPVNTIRRSSAIGWDRIDGEHLLLNVRPSESWLLTLSGNCLDWGKGSPVLNFSSPSGWMVSKYDRVSLSGSPVTCRIEEIRPVDIKALRATQDAMQAKAQASGT